MTAATIVVRNTTAELVVCGKRVLTRPILVTLSGEKDEHGELQYTADWYETGMRAFSSESAHDALQRLGRAVESMLTTLETKKLTDLFTGMAPDEAKRMSAALGFYAYGPQSAMATLA